MGEFDPSSLVLAAVLAICAITDLRAGRILNVITYPAIAFGLLWSTSASGVGFPSSIAGCLVGGATLYVFFASGWMGGGDVKLMAAVGAVKGFPFILNAMFYSTFLGGTCAALILIWRGETRAVVGDLAGLVRRAAGYPVSVHVPPRGGSFPFGVAICLGTLAALVLEIPRFSW